MTRSRLSVCAARFFLALFCSFLSSQSRRNNCCRCWAGRQQSGLRAWSSFRRRCSAPTSMRTGWRNGRDGFCTLPCFCVGFVVGGRLVRAERGRGRRVRPIRSSLCLPYSAAPSDLPFLVLGTTSPLMQVWWARLHGSGIPYRLFALSNLASLLALGLYPTLIEPRLTLEAQRITWCCGICSLRS